MLLNLLTPEEKIIGLEKIKKKIMKKLCRNELNTIFDSRHDGFEKKESSFTALKSQFKM